MSEIANKLAAKLKSSVENLDATAVQGIMMKLYQTARLVDENFQWVTPKLAGIAGSLLPPTTTAADAMDLIDRMQHAVEKNPYMVEFFKQAEGKSFTTLSKKLETEGATILPAVVCYAMVQENLTTAMYNDHTLIEELVNIWVPAREKSGIERGLSTFHRLKLATVEKPMHDYLEFHSTGNIPANYGKLDLPLNIFEATAEDIAGDRVDNAHAGAILAFNPPGELPARFSEDKNGVMLFMPNSKPWADLYAIWNMAFVSHFEYFPFVMVKLMIPKVNDYADEPELYMYIRTLALYTHLHFSFFGQFDTHASGQEPMHWYDEELTNVFGKVARESAEKYEESLRK